MTQPPMHRLKERLVYQNAFATIYDDEVAFPGGEEGGYLRVQPGGDGPGVVVMPLHEATVAFVFTYRYPVDRWQWGLPRGFSQGADPLETARGELREELGVTDARVRLLGYMTPDSGLLESRVAVVLAEVNDPRIAPTDEREVAGVRWVPFTEIDAQVASGSIEDGFTLAALCLARALGEFS